MNRKKFLTLALAACLVFALAGYAFASGFTDISGHWAELQINKWANDGLAGGYDDGTFRPNSEVSRAEFVAMVNRAFSVKKQNVPAAGFKDVQTGKWYYNDVNIAKAAGYIGGYADGTFRPNQSISRQEAASILVRLMSLEQAGNDMPQFKDATSFATWSRGSIAAVVKAGLMGGFPDNTFKPAKSITRAESVVTLDRALEKYGDEVIIKSALEGKVTYNGKPVANAVVCTFSAGDYKALQETKTDKDGKYKFDLEAGNYDLTASTSQQVAYLDSAKVTAGETAKANLEMVRAAVLKGKLVDKNNATLKETKILFTTNPTFIAVTNGYGEFTVSVLPDRSYTVRAYEPKNEDKGPQLIEKELQSGAAGDHQLDTMKAPFSITSAGGGGGGGFGGGGPQEVKLDEIKISPDVSSLTIGVGEQVSLKANLYPSNTTQTGVKWNVVNGSNVISLTENETAATVKGGSTPGEAEVKVVSTENSSKYDIIDINVVKVQEVDVTIDTPVDLEESNESVKVITTVTLGDNNIPLAVILPSVPAGTTMEISEVPSAVEPSEGLLAFLGLDLTINISGVEVTVELPLPDGLTVDDAGAFHYNGNVWEYKDATVVNGKLVFNTKLSPVAVSKKMPAPKDLSATVDGSSVKLSWTASPEGSNNDKITVSYDIFRDDINIKSNVTAATYTDSDLEEGQYTYYVKAYRNVEAGSDKIIRFESAPSESVTANIGAAAPKINSFAGNAPDGNDILVDLIDINTKTTIDVSQNCTLKISLEGLSSYGEFTLVSGANDINNILVPNISISAADLTALFNALKQVDNAEINAIIEGVDFGALFDAISSASEQTKSSILDSANFINAFDAVKSAPTEYKNSLLSNLSTVLPIMINDTNKLTIVNAIKSAELLSVLSSDEIVAILEAIDSGEISDIDFSGIFQAIADADEDTQDAIIAAVNLQTLFDEINKLDSNVRNQVLGEISFTDLYSAIINSTNEQAKQAFIAEDLPQIIETAASDTNINRLSLISSLNLNQVKVESLYNWLKIINDNKDTLEINAEVSNNNGKTSYNITIE